MFTAIVVLCSLLLLEPAASASAEVLVVYGSTTCISRFLEPGAADLEKATNIQVRTVGVGTGQGLFGLLQGQAKVSAASEDLQAAIESAKKYAASKQVRLGGFEYLRYHQITDDEVVVIVHKDNPVKNLTWKQLKAINAGEVKNWKEVGGQNIPIRVVTSHAGSATRLFFQKLVMGNAAYTEQATVVWTTEKEIAEVSADKGAIGAVSVTFHAKAPKDTIRMNTVRIVRPLGLITYGQPTQTVQKMIDFFTIGEGRKYSQGLGE
jgi:phosphate transport system substrate-binding protein